MRQSIVCEGEHYASFKEFANYYGLNYSKAQYYRKRGKSPEEIISLCQFSLPNKATLSPKESTKRFLCEYNGVKYSSIQNAANALGISPSKIYELRKRGNLSASEAIAAAVELNTNPLPKKEEVDKLLLLPCKYKGVEYASLYEAATALGIHPSKLYDVRRKNNLSPSSAIEAVMKKLKTEGKGPAHRAKKCIVDGIEYESREAAMLAYHIPRITVYSRMERDGISFEEALSKGRKATTYFPPAISLYPSLQLKQTENPINQPTLESLKKSLRYYGKEVKDLKDVVTHLPVLLVDDCVYIFFNHEAKGIEFVSMLPISISAEELAMLNNSYVVAKLFFDKTGQIFMSSFQITKEAGQDAKTVLYAYFSYASLREQLLRTYRLDK